MGAERNALLEIIACSARLGAYERPLVADETVEQAAFTGVGFAEITVLTPSGAKSLHSGVWQ